MNSSSVSYQMGLKLFLTIIRPILHFNGVCGAGLSADRIPHASAAIALDGHFKRRRRIDNPKGAYHHAHPTCYTGGLVNIDQAVFRIFSHGAVRAGIQARGLFTLTALKCKRFSLHEYPGYRLRFLIDGKRKLFGHRCDFRSAPELALMATCTFFRVNFDYLQCVLLFKRLANCITYRYYLSLSDDSYSSATWNSGTME